VYEVSHRDRGQGDEFGIIAKINCVIWLLLGVIVLIYGVLEKCQKDPAYIKKFILSLLLVPVFFGSFVYFIEYGDNTRLFEKSIEEPLFVNGADGKLEYKPGKYSIEWHKDMEKRETEMTWGQIAIVIIFMIFYILCPPLRKLVDSIIITIGLCIGINWVINKLKNK